MRITEDVQQAIDESGIKEGLVLVNVMNITDGKLDFGTWEQFFYYELDGKKHKHALIKIIGE